jgi:gluconolactonase
MSELSRRGFLAAGVASTFAARAAFAADSYGTIRRVSTALDNLIEPGTPVEQIAYGYYWTEGPVWVKNGGYLLFSDPDKNIVYRWTAAEGAGEFLNPSGFDGTDSTLREPGANGLAMDAAGALVMCDSGNRALARVDLASKKKKIIVDRYDGKRFNSPNDLCIARSGAIYFTDPCYGLEGMENSPARETPYAGVYRWTPDGQIALIDKSLPRPNGIALSPDEGTLYVSNTGPTQPVITSYQLGADGLPTSSSAFFDTTPMMTPEAKGNVDGLKVDESGNLFATSPAGVLVLSKEAKLLGLIGVSARMVSNCAFGEDGSSLFITATDIVARVRLKTRGAIT